jgi:ubiquitin carboxyl-terminal hydrolase L3
LALPLPGATISPWVDFGRQQVRAKSSALTIAKRPAMDQLLGMGFSEEQCKKALAEAGNVDGAVSYIFANADKPPEFWAESAAPAAAEAAAVAPTHTEARAPAGATAATIQGELPGVLGDLRPVAAVATEALQDPGFVAELMGEAPGVDVDRVVHTITGMPSPKRFAGAGPTPEAIAEKAVEYFVSALDKRWGEYVGALNAREVALVAADARRMARRGSVTDRGALEAKSAALAALTSGDSPQTLKMSLSTDEGAALAREIILLEGGALPSVGAPPLPEPELAAPADPKPKSKKGKHRPEPESQGVLEIEIEGECTDGECALGSTVAIPFCVAEFGASRAALSSQALVQTDPPLADSDLANADALSGQIAVCTRGAVPFIEKARRAQASGAVALLVLNAGGESEPEPDLLFGFGGAGDAEEPITIPVVGVGAADGERLLAAGVASLRFDWNPHSLELLHDAFTVANYDGGQESEETAVANVLVPKLKPFHCSKPGVGHTLTLKCDDEKVTVTHIVIHAAAMCTAPLRHGELSVTSAAFSSSPRPGGAEALARIPFECPKDTMQFVYTLPQPVGGGVSIDLKMVDTWNDEQPNVDIAMVAIVGHKDGTETAEALSTAAAAAAEGAAAGGGLAVPRNLKVTNLLRFVQRKKWMPLESDRDILTGYLHKIGFPQSYCFHDVLAFEDWAVDMVPGPALALVLLFPVTKETEAARKAEEEAIEKDGQAVPQSPPLLHIRQNIGNACGTIGLLHAACHTVLGNQLADGEGTAAVAPESWLGKFVSKAKGLDAEAAGDVLEDDVEIEDAHAAAEAASHDAAARSQNVRNHFTAIVHRCDCTSS